jgi:quercetin dioxygenase-like cupin family protein
MTLAFDATRVDCADALGGEILQVSFDTAPEDQDEDERSTPYVLIGRNFEFPDSATIEWRDAHDYDGGAEIVFVTLKRARISIRIDRELDFEVAFRLPDKEFAKLTSFEKGAVSPRHKHPMEEVLMIVEGGGEFLIDEDIHTVGKGDVVILPPLSLHQFTAMSDGFPIEIFHPKLTPEIMKMLQGGGAKRGA